MLPFLNLAPTTNEGDYFSDGLTEELIDSLARLDGLRVVARTSAFAFKSTPTDVREIGKRLGVEAVIEGSVRTQGNRIRVTVQMSRTSDGFHFWSQTYERTTGDLLGIQQEVASQVSALLSAATGVAAHLQHRPNPETYTLYLRGRQFARQSTRQGRERAIGMYREAIARDPQFASAYVALADEYNPFSQLVPEARRLLDKALILDPDLWEAHAAIGRLKAEADWDWPGSEASFRRAIQLSPGAARAHRRYGRILARLGRHSDAIRELEMAVRLDPLSEDDQVFLAEALFFGRRFEDSLRECQATLALFPNSWRAHLNMGLAYDGLKRYSEAIHEFQQAQSLNGDNPSLGYYGALGHAFAASGNKQEARKFITQLIKTADSKFVSPVHLARIYAGLEEYDAAFQHLEKAADRRDQDLLWLKVDPRFDCLRGDPRYQSLLSLMNLR